MQIGSNIKNLRNQKNISQKELAHKLGVTPVYLSMVENNAKKPSLSLMENISQILGIPLALFFMEMSLAA